MNRFHTIILDHNGINEEVNFITRNEFKAKYYQDKLENYHKKQNMIRCKCDLKKELYLSVGKKKRYYLSKYPKGEEHAPTCIFNSYSENLTSDGDNTAYSIDIFSTPKTTTSQGSQKVDIDNDREKAVRTTYYQYCNDLISFANVNAFYIANNKENRQNSLLGINNFSFDDFCTAYYSALKKINIIKNGNVLDIQKANKNFKFYYGIIDDFESIKEIVTSLSKLKLEDTIKLPVQIISFDYKNKCNLLIEDFLTVTVKRLKIALKLVKHEGQNSLRRTPYFFAASVENGISVRLHLSLIYYKDNKICFVDSHYERKFAHHFFKNNQYATIRPLTNNEIDDLFPTLIGLPNVLDNVPHIAYNPDFLLFDRNIINIVEVSGYTNKEEYKQHMEKKMRYYQKLCNSYSFFEYTVYSGETGKVINKSIPSDWDGTIVIEKGKNKDKMWKDLKLNSLKYYIQNFDPENEYYLNSLKELYRRDRIEQ